MADFTTSVLQTLNNNFRSNSKILAIFGTVTATYLSLKSIYSFLSGVRSYFLVKAFGTDLNKLGDWAVVTGSTDGIGKGFAFELARRGINIILISRSPEKLKDVAQEIAETYKVQTKVIAVDFTGGPEIYDKVGAELDGVDIGVLVNNVGIVTGLPNLFGDIEDAKIIQDMVNVNVNAVTRMSHIVLPRMVEKKKGAIINISSGLGLFPCPAFSVYSATKAYVSFLGQALQAEYRSKGIIVQTVTTFHVATKMSEIEKTSLFIPDPMTYARSALRTVGVEEVTCGYWGHSIQAVVFGWIPRSVVERIFLGMATLNKLKNNKDK